MTNPHFDPVPDGSRAGRVAEGGSRHEAVTATDGVEWVFRDRHGDEGFVHAGLGIVALEITQSNDAFEPVTAGHLLDPDAAELLACRLLAAATIARRRTR